MKNALGSDRLNFLIRLASVANPSPGLLVSAVCPAPAQQMTSHDLLESLVFSHKCMFRVFLTHRGVLCVVTGQGALHARAEVKKLQMPVGCIDFNDNFCPEAVVALLISTQGTAIYCARAAQQQAEPCADASRITAEMGPTASEGTRGSDAFLLQGEPRVSM